MALIPVIGVTQSFPSCSTIRYCDLTKPYNGDRTSPLYNPTGYGAPNPAISSITSTEIWVLAPGSTVFEQLDVSFLPTQGCIDFDTTDLRTLGIVVPDICHTCNNNPPATKILGEFTDGCWAFKYNVFATGQKAIYDLSMAAFPSYEISMFIDGVGYYFFNIQSAYYLSLALNQLNLGIWTLQGSVLTADGLHTYGMLVTDAGNIAPTITSDQILVGTTTQNFFFHCGVSNEVIADLMSAYSGNNSCDDLALTEMLWDINLAYQTLLIAAATDGCNCSCVNDYLVTLQTKLTRYNGYLKDCTG